MVDYLPSRFWKPAGPGPPPSRKIFYEVHQPKSHGTIGWVCPWYRTTGAKSQKKGPDTTYGWVAKLGSSGSFGQRPLALHARARADPQSQQAWEATG